MALKPRKSKYIIGAWFCSYCDNIHYSEDAAYYCCSQKEDKE